MQLRRPFVVSAIVCVFAISTGVAAQDQESRTHSDMAHSAHLKADSRNLKHTITTPHLHEAIPENTNVLWCSTFQLAWNELCDLAGGPIKMDDPPAMVAILNERRASKNDLDEASYVVLAGLRSRGIYEKIERMLRDKFHGQANPRLFKQARKQQLDWVAYAYLHKSMPFRWAFTRFEDSLRFQGVRVDCFGIDQLLRSSQPDEAKMATQVAVLDYQGPDNLIVELRTRAVRDRLILAKVLPKATLGETVAAVEHRIAGKKPTSMREMSDLYVPVLDFDLFREYDELYGKPIHAPHTAIDGDMFVLAAQSIRFRLDETGAVLTSEAIAAGGLVHEHIIFDKPFLLLLKRREATRPYLALWVGNVELLNEKRDSPPSVNEKR